MSADHDVVEVPPGRANAQFAPDAGSSWRTDLLKAVVLIGVFVALAQLVRPSLVFEGLIYGLLGASVALLLGYLALPSLGHAVFFGIGGYAVALIGSHVTDDALAQLVVAVMTGMVFAAVVGPLAVRLAGVYFLMIMVALGELVFRLALVWRSVTGGENGLVGLPAARLTAVPGVGADRALEVLLIASVLGSYLGLRQLARSPYGLVLRGIRENEQRMTALGYATGRYKLCAFVVSGALAGWAGGLLVQQSRFVSAANLAIGVSVLALIIVLIAGSRSIGGAIVVGVGLVVLKDEISSRVEIWQLVLGLLFIVIVYLLPHGLSGIATGLWGRLRRRRAAGSAPSSVSARSDRVAVRPAPTARDTAPSLDAPVVLSAAGLSKTFGGVRAVEDVSFDVRAGERWSVIGPNGAGKSTVVDLIAGRLTPTDGRVEIGGEDVTSVAEHVRATRLGRTFQRSSLFEELTVLEHGLLATVGGCGLASRLRWSPSRLGAAVEPAVRALEEFGLADLQGDPASSLSHGQRRRLELAVTLASRPSIVLFDEPTAGLTSEERDRLARAIFDLPDDTAIVVVEHDIDFVMRVSSHVLVMDMGRVVTVGTPQHVARDPDVRRAYFGADVQPPVAP